GCHGKAIGQNGFKLSLFGFDPEFDYAALVNEGLGRRVSPAAPDNSLMLIKATGAMPHGGGVRFSSDSESYRLVRRWIEQGLAFSIADEPHDVKLEVTPNEIIAQEKSRHALRVVVHYSNGTTRDVTQFARFDTQHPDILTVGPDGVVLTTGRPGETSVMVRYQNCVATSRCMTLTEQVKPDAVYTAFKPKSFIDELILAKWRKLHIAPSPDCDDVEFLRRVSLDAMGTLPTPQEVRDFVANSAPDKRDALVDRILQRDEFFDLWAHRLGDLLRNRLGDSNAKDNTIGFAKWIRKSLVENKPYDQFVREIITVTGKRSDHPQMDWYRWAITNENRVEDTSQAFLGLRVSCANCHNHPFEKVSQGDYWQFAAFFARVKSVSYGSVDELGLEEKGEIKHPRTEQVLVPKVFGGAQFAYVAGEDPRKKLAEWLTAADNPYFARAICNRVWGHYMGVGLVEPVDDMRATNPPSNPELLDALARDFVANKFDLKHLMRTILKSRAYGLSSAPTDDNRSDTRNYARFYSRRMQPYVLLDAISSATGVPQKFEDYPDVKKAILLPNEKARSEFLEIFGRSERTTPCECETSLAPNLSQVLYLLNSDELQRKLTDKAGIAVELSKPEKKPAEVIEELYLRTFSRMPKSTELQDAVSLLEMATDRRPVIEDVLWTLLNSKEFLFNH
ncbi:MAG: Ig-like protein, partial [Planctomycetaceae bacterium]|nr:Ig-like protein [Planctomycetaceae bacterium]